MEGGRKKDRMMREEKYLRGREGSKQTYDSEQLMLKFCAHKPTPTYKQTLLLYLVVLCKSILLQTNPTSVQSLGKQGAGMHQGPIRTDATTLTLRSP